jgi:hypothetical protein
MNFFWSITGGLMGYTSPRWPAGQHLVVDWAENLDDISYDGDETSNLGLGQLADGVVTDNRTSINGTFFGQFLFFSFVFFENGEKSLKSGRVLNGRIHLNNIKSLMNNHADILGLSACV